MTKLRNELTWSASRDNQFKSCERAYYYQYYGSWGGWERDADDRTRHIYLLKNIKPMIMWAGSIVHETIAESLERFAQTGRNIQSGELLAIARQKMRLGWVEARDKAWKKRPKLTNLSELYFGDGATLPKDDTDFIKERINNCLTSFAESSVLRQILLTPYMDWKPIDKLDHFSYNGLKIWCAIDFAYLDNQGILRIIDWKTGKESRDSLQTQLACYAFYASEKWHAQIDKIRICGAFLNDNSRLSQYNITPEIMVQAQEDIMTSVNAMREKLVNVESNIAKEEDFEPCSKPYICKRCNYREICPGFVE